MRRNIIAVIIVLVTTGACSSTIVRSPYRDYPRYAVFKNTVPIKTSDGRILIYKLNGGLGHGVYINGKHIGYLGDIYTFTFFDGPDGEYEVGIRAGLGLIFKRIVKIVAGKITYVENIQGYELAVIDGDQGAKDVLFCNYVEPKVPSY